MKCDHFYSRYLQARQFVWTTIRRTLLCVNFIRAVVKKYPNDTNYIVPSIEHCNQFILMWQIKLPHHHLKHNLQVLLSYVAYPYVRTRWHHQNIFYYNYIFSYYNKTYLTSFFSLWRSLMAPSTINTIVRSVVQVTTTLRGAQRLSTSPASMNLPL